VKNDSKTISNDMDFQNSIESKIYTIRGVNIMLDRDLAKLYQVETRRINEQVKRNIERFPEDFMFRLTKEELKEWKSQNATTNSVKMGMRKLPLAFTEQGVYMLATILKSSVATQVNIAIMRTFTKVKKFLDYNSSLFDRFERIEYKLAIHDENFNKVFKAIEDKREEYKQGVFYNGQIFDAYVFVNGLLKSAKKSVIVIDNYIDYSVLVLFSKYSSLKFTIVTKNISNQLKLDIKKYNLQYNNLTVKISNKFHDRFVILDKKEAYHIGHSLKDLGNKIFAFSKIDIKTLKDIEEIL
jgi:hypothetical protein